MCVRKTVGGSTARRWACLGAWILGGCGTVDGLIEPDRSTSTLSLTTLGIDGTSTFWESDPNNVFENAEFVDLGAASRVVRGRVNDPDDVDVYDFGPVQPGDRIVVEMTTADSLDGVIALFDDTGASLLINDHRNVYLGRSEPFVDLIIRRPSDSCWLAVSATPGYATTGDYVLVASKGTSVPLREHRPSVVLLDFEGSSNVRIGSRQAIEVPRFDARRISPDLGARQTQAMIDQIVAAVRDDYAGFDVQILSTSEGSRYDSSMSRLFFGADDDALLGVAEGVDEFNSDPRQEAIVFADTFSAFLRLDPSVSELAQAIANVASHEIGHLLGLVHTKDPAGLMDVTASLRALMRDQSFRKSSIYSAVFPIGFQDAVQSLLDTVGGDPFFARVKEFAADQQKMVLEKDANPTPARTQSRLSLCGFGRRPM